jgi:hypothetical protein
MSKRRAVGWLLDRPPSPIVRVVSGGNIDLDKFAELTTA